jgi:5'(3')-deoxyribonucleotidase
MTLRVAIDMDGVLTDFGTPFRKKIKELYGIECNKEYVDARKLYSLLSPEQQELFNNHRELYGILCGPRFFLDLEPYPGAVEAVQSLYEAEYHIIFLTKPLNWDRSAPEKAEWLKKHFPNMNYDIIMVDSVKSKHIIDVDIIIDDDIRVLEGVELATKICIAQPWNKSIQNKFGIVVADLKEAAEYIISTTDQHEIFESNWLSQ